MLAHTATGVLALGFALGPALGAAAAPQGPAAVSIDFGAGKLVDGGAAIAVPITVVCDPGAVPSVPVALKVTQPHLDGGLASGVAIGTATCGAPTTLTVGSTQDLFKVGPAAGQAVAAAPGGTPVTHVKAFQVTP